MSYSEIEWYYIDTQIENVTYLGFTTNDNISSFEINFVSDKFEQGHIPPSLYVTAETYFSTGHEYIIKLDFINSLYEIYEDDTLTNGYVMANGDFSDITGTKIVSIR